MNRVDRLVAIVVRLQSRRVVRAEDLAAHFEIVPAMIGAERIRGVDEPVASAAPFLAVVTEEAVPSLDPRRWPALSLTDLYTGDFWETLNYAALWLCGLVGVGLCFL